MQQRDRWLWPFELQEKIGEGGMGVVYRARYVVNDRQVAVKLLPPDVSDPVLLSRFERELEILKTLKHPHIVRCFGGACEDKRRFYAMELIEGGTLDVLLRERGRFSWEQAIDYGLQICAALAYAHAHGIVHRDVKPGNFLIAGDGKLKLSDFGLVSVAAARKITAAGKTMGTYSYMAPEQIRGQTVSAKTDLYALGCVLFEMLAGRPPFVGDTSAEILHQHLKQKPPRVSTLAIDCPPSLETLITELLDKDPDQRPADAAQVARRLQNVSQVVTVETVHHPSRGVGNRPTVGAARPDRAEASAAPPSSGAPSWLVAGAAVLLAALLVWNVSLMRERQFLSRSEALWIEAAQSEDRSVRVAAIRALGELGPASSRAVHTLTEGLEDESPEVRQESAAALGEVGARARSAVPRLRRMQKTDDEPAVRHAVVQAVEDIRNAPSSGRSPWFYLVIAVVVGGLVGGFRMAKKRIVPS